MAVHQVEEFYIHKSIGTNILSDELKAKIEAYMEENCIDEFEWQDGDLVIDGFDCENMAEGYDIGIREVIEQHVFDLESD